MRRCLAKDAKRLLRDVGDVRIELQEALAGGAEEEPGGADPAGGRRLSWVLVCVALVAAASGAAG